MTLFDLAEGGGEEMGGAAGAAGRLSADATRGGAAAARAVGLGAGVASLSSAAARAALTARGSVVMTRREGAVSGAGSEVTKGAAAGAAFVACAALLSASAFASGSRAGGPGAAAAGGSALGTPAATSPPARGPDGGDGESASAGLREPTM